MRHNELINILQRKKDQLFKYVSYRLPNTADAEDALQDLDIAMVMKVRDIWMDNPIPYAVE